MKKLIIVLILLLFYISANSQKRRLALVIGNGNYPMSILANPVNDAIEIEALLKSSGFQVKRYTDLDQTAMKRVIDEFGSSLNSAEVGLFFYAGHGIQANGRNYLIPVDASLKTENDVEYNCVDAGRILAKMEDAGTKTNIVILDACRDNPFERSWSRKSTGQGLAFMDAPMGSLIAYSTAPGKTASDGSGKNSPYTSALIQYMKIPNVKIEDFFKKVRVLVREKTQGKQTPWEATSLEGDFYFQFDPDYELQEIPVVVAVEPTINYPDNIAQTEQRLLNFEENKKRLAAEIRSIAILPFAIYTGDESQVYLVSGMHDALITELGQIGAIRVVGKTSTLQYANFQKTIKEIASELNVDGIIEASVLIINENIRIQLRLFSAFPEEQQLWSQTFNSDMSNILNLYNLVIKDIANEIQLTLSPEQQTQLAEKRQVNPEAYDSYLMGLYLLEDADLESLNKAREYLNSAVEKNPDWAPLYSSLAQVWATIVQMGFESPEIAGPKIIEYRNKALELDPNNVDSHFANGMIAFLTEWDWEKAEMELLKALAANPNDAMSRVIYAQLLGCLQRPGESLTQGRLAIGLDPLNPLIQVFHSVQLLNIGDYKTALAYGEKITSGDPGHFMANSLIEFAAFLCRDYNKVMEAAKYIFAAKEEEVDFKEVERIFGETGFVAAYEEILRQLEVLAQKGYTAPVEMAYRYMMVDQPDKAMEWIEKGFEVRDPVMPYIATHGFLFEPLFDNPRFIEIIQKMNLPLPED